MICGDTSATTSWKPFASTPATCCWILAKLPRRGIAISTIFWRFPQAAEPELREGAQVWEWIDRLDDDFDNIQSALEWGQEGRPEDALLLAGNLFLFYLWSYRGIAKPPSTG